MAVSRTILFIDLTGSTQAFQNLGNEKAASVVSQITHWIGRVCEAHAGKVIKFLGDGVLAGFESAGDAVGAAVFIQQSHTHRIRSWPQPLQMGLKIGIASGQVIDVGNDAYGDPVNLASRLSDMAGTDAIWASHAVLDELDQLPNAPALRHRGLGAIHIRGLAEPQTVFQIEWNEDVSTDLLTMQGGLGSPAADQIEAHGGAVASILLTRQARSRVLAAGELPANLGRGVDCTFTVADQRVSRLHARIEVVNGTFVLNDLSTFGTWVRFSDVPSSEVHLRRNQCALHSSGEIALGAPFNDSAPPVVAFVVRLGDGDGQGWSASRR